jgi:hypothetical protein
LIEERLDLEGIFLRDVLVRARCDKAENIRQRRFDRIVWNQASVGERECGVGIEDGLGLGEQQR